MAGGGAEALVALTVQKLATVSLLNVFLSILPGYRVRERTEQEKEHKVGSELEFPALESKSPGLLS